MPGVASINAIKRIVQFTGIIIGVVAGDPLLAEACLKWLAHDILVEAVSKEIGDFFTSTRERDLKDPEVEREISGQIEELKERLETPPAVACRGDRENSGPDLDPTGSVAA